MILNVLIFFANSLSAAFIQHDSRQFFKFNKLDQSTFICENGYSVAWEQVFLGQFQNTPQIIIATMKTQTTKATSPSSLEFEFNIYSISTTSFWVSLTCPSLKVVELNFYWFAFDNQNIQVINKFNQLSFENYTIAHSNPKATVGFVSLIGFGYSGPLEFSITLSSITESSAYVAFNNPNDLNKNIKSLTYQIIFAPPEYLINIGTVDSSSNYFSQGIPVLTNTFFMVTMLGYKYLNTDIIRLRIVQQSTDPITYNIQDNTGTYVANKHAQIQLSYIYYLPLKCDHIRISKKFSPSMPSKSIILQVIGNNNLFTEGEYTMTIDSSIANINLSIQFICQIGKKIVSSFFKYPDKIDQYQMITQSHNCYGEGNLITYYPRFIQQIVSYQSLSIKITSTSCQMIQLLDNQLKAGQPLISKTLMTLTLVDQ